MLANETLAVSTLYAHGEQWFMFLADTRIPATNHRAEQALKVPIVNRKVWGGNRTDAGAEAQAVTSSVLQTCGEFGGGRLHVRQRRLCGVLGKKLVRGTTSL